MKRSLVLRSSIATLSALAVVLPTAYSATTDDYESGILVGTATGTVNGQPGPLPSILDDGAGTSKFLRLLAGVNGESNRYVYNQTDAGLWETITASFDFRIKPSTAGLADGFHFALIPTAQFGTTGDGPNMLAEEPNAPGTFGMGIDVYPGINNISTHWNNVQAAETAVPTTDPGVPFRSNQLFNRVKVELQRVGNATNALISIQADPLGAVPGTPFVLMSTVIPNMLPFDNRVQFGGRTGGENLILDLDNINVAYANTFDPGVIPDAPAVAATHLYQDFDSRGSTSFTPVNGNPPSATGFRPGPLMKAAEQGSSGAFLRIVNNGVNSQNNRIAFHRAADGGASNATEVLDFDVRFNSPADAPADGMGLLFLPTKNPTNNVYSAVDEGIGSSEEPNHFGAFGIGFDLYSNDVNDPAGSVSLHWNGINFGEYPIDPSLALGQFNHVKVIRETASDGINVTIVGTPIINGVAGAPVTVVNNVYIPGPTLYDYRVQLSARTGGLDADVDIDNLQTSQIARAPLARTEATFASNSGSGWKGYAYGFNGNLPAGPAPEIRNDGGINQDYLHLSNDTSNGIANAVTFDQQLDGVTAGKSAISAKFSARVTNLDGATAADGFSFMLIPVSTFGTTGPGVSSTGGFAAEEPNFAGVFGIGFDAYNSGPQFSELSVHWNGGMIASVETLSMFSLDIVNAEFIQYKIDLQQIDTGTILTLALTPGIYGAPGAEIKVFDELLIPGMSLYDYRVEFAARTGGLNLGVDIDDILIQTIPEPSSALLLGLGGLLLNRRRRIK